MINEYFESIKYHILQNQADGQTFAFITTKENYEIWHVISYVFTEFLPEPKCNYHLEVWRVNGTAIEELSKDEIESLDELITYLTRGKINPENRRAIH